VGTFISPKMGSLLGTFSALPLFSTRTSFIITALRILRSQ
jgi:hypothetical protein